jgi:NAD(P)H-flavin reductase
MAMGGSFFNVVLVGGGVGITPVRALIDEFKNGVQMDVIYRASRKEDLVLKEELDYLEYHSNGSIRVHYLVGSRKDHPMDADALKKLVPAIADSDVISVALGHWLRRLSRRLKI